MGRSSPVSAELDELPLPEVAVGKLRVWKGETLRIYHPVPELHDVEVDGPRAPALAALPAEQALDLQQLIEQRLRRHRRLQRHHLVEEIPLWLRSDRRRLLDGRFAQ